LAWDEIQGLLETCGTGLTVIRNGRTAQCNEASRSGSRTRCARGVPCVRFRARRRDAILRWCAVATWDRQFDTLRETLAFIMR